MTEKIKPEWSDLLLKAVAEPGIIHRAYRMFHDYSLGNSFWVLAQILTRGVEPGPVASFMAWKKQGRCVKKGEKALAMYMPVMVGRKAKGKEAEDAKEEENDGRPKAGPHQIFIARNHWFALSQTEPIPDADEVAPESTDDAPTDFDPQAAIDGLGFKLVRFDAINGNMMGYSHPTLGELAISPLSYDPVKTACHEMAHCLLHGAKEGGTAFDCGGVDHNLMEVEAEATAMLVCASIGHDEHLDASRGYIRAWLNRSSENVIPDANAQRIFGAASKILKAGTAEV